MAPYANTLHLNSPQKRFMCFYKKKILFYVTPYNLLTSKCLVLGFLFSKSKDFEKAKSMVKWIFPKGRSHAKSFDIKMNKTSYYLQILKPQKQKETQKKCNYLWPHIPDEYIIPYNLTFVISKTWLHFFKNRKIPISVEN